MSGKTGAFARRVVRIAACVLACMQWTIAPLFAQRPATFVRRAIQEGGRSYPYQVFIPQDYDSTRAWPVVLFLHGGAEGGHDGKRQLDVGLGPTLRQQPGLVRALVVLPQVPMDSIWAGLGARVALHALDDAIAAFHGDSNRVYLTGISMGGYGTWQLALERPAYFAALVPIAGGVRPLRWAKGLRVRTLPDTTDPVSYVAGRVGAVPTWVFHNAHDWIVPPADDRQIVAALRRAGAPVHLTEYPSYRHNAWNRAYADSMMWRWMLAQQRNGIP